MKINHIHVEILLVLFVLIAIFPSYSFSQEGEPVPVTPGEFTIYDLPISKLQERLTLTEEQVAILTDASKMMKSQEKLDQENFKANAMALIAAALRREQMIEMKLMMNLNEEQKTKLTSLKDVQRKDRELFTLKEGLILTPEQTEKVQAIIRLQRSKTPKQDGSNMEDYEYMSGFSGLMNNSLIRNQLSGVGNTQYPGQMQDYDQDQMMRDQAIRRMRMTESFSDKLLKLEEEKEEGIEKILTNEQKKRFDQLKIERRKEFDKAMEKMKEQRQE